MSRTGAQLLSALSDFLNDDWSSTTTSAGASSGGTLIDTGLRRFGNDAIRGWYLRPTGAANPYAIRRITSFADATGTATVSPPFAAQAPSGQTYDLHRFDPARKFAALDKARLRGYPDLAQIVYDDTVFSDGSTQTFAIPTTIRKGPAYVFQENAVPPEPAWNFIQDPRGDSVTNWAASSITASIVSENDADLEVPKYREDCTKFVVAASTAGTYSQVVGSMANDASASGAAGRKMTFAAWVYSNLADKIRLQILDDGGATSGTQHQGRGWELLTVEKTIRQNNSSTLTAVFDVDNDSNPITAYWNRAWLYYGSASRVRDIYFDRVPERIRRDDTTQTFETRATPPRGINLRLVGRTTLSALGATASSQVTNTMEVDEASSQLLLATAARILLEDEGLLVDDQNPVLQRVGVVEERRREYAVKWPFTLPATPQARSVWG